jgi:hypothetical protein
MGYITYNIHYGHGEVWTETRVFNELFDMMRLTSQEFLSSLAEEYQAEYVHVESLYVNGQEVGAEALCV